MSRIKMQKKSNCLVTQELIQQRFIKYNQTSKITSTKIRPHSSIQTMQINKHFCRGIQIVEQLEKLKSQISDKKGLSYIDQAIQVYFALGCSCSSRDGINSSQRLKSKVNKRTIDPFSSRKVGADLTKQMTQTEQRRVQVYKANKTLRKNYTRQEQSNQQEIRYKRCTSYYQQHRDLENNIDQKDEQIEHLRQKLERTRNRLLQAQEMNKSNKKQISQLKINQKEKIDRLKRQIDQKNQQQNRRQTQLSYLKNKIKEIQRSRNDKCEQVIKVKGKLQNANKQLGNLLRVIGRLQELSHECRQNARKRISQINHLSRKVEEFEQTVGQLQFQAQNRQLQIVTLKLKIQNME